MREAFFAAAELKFVGDDEPGVFTGYGSVFNRMDHHRDVVLPGAFGADLEERKAKGLGLPTMYMMHEQANPFIAARPVGRWLDIVEDGDGLAVKGVIGALDCESGRQVRASIRDQLTPGLSIAFSVPRGGAIYGKAANEPRRQLKQLKLFSIDIVDQPSNPGSLIQQIKSIMPAAMDHAGAIDALLAAEKLHRAVTAGGNSPTIEQRQQISDLHNTAHRCITGQDMPAMRGKPNTEREFDKWLQAAAERDGFALSNSEARTITNSGWKTLAKTPPDEADAASSQATRAAIQGIAESLRSFTL
jgi:uncharacterized protein